MYKFIILTFCLLNALTAQVYEEAQKIKIRNIGPSGMSGRFTSIAVNKLKHIYAGSASGGIWKSEDGGFAWKPIFDDESIQSIGALAISNSNNDLIWAGTGEGNPRNSHNSGNGIYKSTNAGKTWTCMGLQKTKNIHRIAIDPTNNNVIVAGVLGVAWGKSAERGIYKSTDGGLTWKNILFVNEETGCAELVIDPNNPNKMIASMWEFSRKPYTFTSGGNGSGIYLTTDGGANWQKISTGLPTGKIGRCGLAIAPSNSNIVYSLVESTEIAMYKSTDGGYTFTKVSNNSLVGNRPFYYAEIYVDPTNENHIYSLWSQITHSIDGGNTWKILASWNDIHPDHHALWIDPTNANYMINGNDGGINLSYNGGKNWRQVDNLPVGQFYHINTDNAFPYNVYGGLQDNGSWRGPGFSFTSGGLRTSQWQELLFGDGFNVLPINPNQGYAMYQGGNLHFYDLIKKTRRYIQPVKFSDAELRFNWNAPICKLPNNGIAIASQFVHVSLNNGLSWNAISPDLTTNDTQKLKQAQSGGLTIDATNAENYCTIVSLACNQNASNTLWAGTDDGLVWQTNSTNAQNWKKVTISALPKNAYIQQIHLSNTPNTVFVVANNYRQNDWKPYLFESKDNGQTWKSLVTDSIFGHCLSFLQDSINPNLYFLGTDQGLYVSYTAGKNWFRLKQIPACPVQDLKYQANCDDLVIGTFGRAIWILDELSIFRTLQNTIKDSLKIIAHEPGFTNQIWMPPGAHFANDDVYKGENKELQWKGFYSYLGAAKTEAKVQILFNNSVIRTFKTKTQKKGINYFLWNMCKDGFHFPNYSKPKPNDELPSGLAIQQSGNYTFIVTIHKKSDTFNQIIMLPTNHANQWGNQKLYDSLKSLCQNASKAFTDLQQAKTKINEIKNKTYLTDSLQNVVIKQCNKTLGLIDTLELLYTLPPTFTAYEDITPRLNNTLYTAYSHITQFEQIQNQPIQVSNAQQSFTNAQLHSKTVFNKINTFFNTHYANLPFNTWNLWLKPETPFGGY